MPRVEADRDWLRRVMAAGYEIERRGNRYVVLDVHDKVLRRFPRRYEAEAYIGKRVGIELRGIQERIDAAAIALVEEQAERYPEDPAPKWEGSLPAEMFGPVVYRAVDRHGQILYVGVTDCLWARMAGHRGSSAWWYAAERIEWTAYASRHKAEQAESAAIRRHLPPHNVVGRVVRVS